jgi:drug/metabolite transporter (DMT)-like permease
MLISPLVPGAEIEWPVREAWLPIAGVGVLGVAAQVVFTRVFRFVSAPIASALSVIALIFSVGFDVVLVGSTPTPYALACYSAILAGAAALHLLELRRNRIAATAEAAQPIE